MPPADTLKIEAGENLGAGFGTHVGIRKWVAAFPVSQCSQQHGSQYSHQCQESGGLIMGRRMGLTSCIMAPGSQSGTADIGDTFLSPRNTFLESLSRPFSRFPAVGQLGAGGMGKG